jgi:hypothetical protein
VEYRITACKFENVIEEMSAASKFNTLYVSTKSEKEQRKKIKTKRSLHANSFPIE